MPSYSRNSRKPLQTLTLAVAAALLTGSVAHAAEASTKFVLTAYTNGAGGDSLVSGDYDAALEAVQRFSSTQSTDASALQTNKCVAYTMKGKLDAARSQCNAAILGAKEDLASASLAEREQAEEYLAVAYSNRAVLNWVANDAVSAARDLASAVTLSPQSEFVARNISALRSPHDNTPREHAVAQLAVAPKS
jgi:hypothetical protein